MKKLLITLFILCPSVLFAQGKWAVVNQSSTFMREKPGYEQENGNQALMGALVQVLDSSSYWYKVKAEDYTAWLTNMGVSQITDAQKEAYLKSEKWMVTAEYSHVYASPSANAARLCDLTMGNLLRKTTCPQASCSDAKKHCAGTKSQCKKESGSHNHCAKAFEQVLLPDGRSGWVPTADLTDFATWAGQGTDAARLVKFAQLFTGTPYMWGGNSPKYFDCSGFTKFTYMMNGIILPRNASQQAKVGMDVFTAGIDGVLNPSVLQPGDLLFFGRRASAEKPHRITHVAIYMGDGKIIHSSHRVRVSELDDYGREVLVARRILGHVDTGEGVVSVLRSPYWFAQLAELE